MLCLVWHVLLVEHNFIQTTFIPSDNCSSRTTFVQEQFHPKPLSFHVHFHPKPLSSIFTCSSVTIFIPSTISSKTTFIQNQNGWDQKGGGPNSRKSGCPEGWVPAGWVPKNRAFFPLAPQLFFFLPFLAGRLAELWSAVQGHGRPKLCA